MARTGGAVATVGDLVGAATGDAVGSPVVLVGGSVGGGTGALVVGATTGDLVGDGVFFTGAAVGAAGAADLGAVVGGVAVQAHVIPMPAARSEAHSLVAEYSLLMALVSVSAQVWSAVRTPLANPAWRTVSGLPTTGKSKVQMLHVALMELSGND